MRTIRLAAVTVIAITISAFVRAQAPAQPQPTGSARLTGRVVAADDGKPVRHAYVSLSGVPDSQRNAGPNRVYVARLGETDLDGRFEFANLPAGSYTVSADPVNGFVRPVQSREATLVEGRTTEITIRLYRGGAIEGRIQDEHGDPVLGAQVHAVRRLDFNGYIQLANAQAQAATDDRGEFRLFGLRPGEYYVVATYAHQDRHRAPPPRSGYANTYYPGAATLQAARAVAVRAGRDSVGVNFSLLPCRLATVKVRAVDAQGVAIKDASVTLTRKDDVHLPMSVRQSRRDDDGTYVVDQVIPGEYAVMVSRITRKPQDAGHVNVTIADQDVTLTVRTNSGATVSGRILIDGQPASAHPQTRNVFMSAFPPPRAYGVMFPPVDVAQLRGTDRFTLTGLRGRLRLHGEIAAGALLSIRRGQEEIAGKTLEFAGTETIDDVVVSLTTNVGQLDVSVIGDGAEPTPVLVMLFAEDPANRHPGYLQYARMMASPKRSSRAPGTSDTPPPEAHRLTRMPAGRYLVVAIEDADLEYPDDTRVFEHLRPLATPLTIVAGQTPSVTLGVAKSARQPR